jgi:S1-C subfamily serine protease
MDVIDIFIMLLIIGALFRGREIGSIRQICSTVGFIGGLLLGAWVGPKFIHLGHTELTRTFITLIITLGLALIGLSIAEYVGEFLKSKLQTHKIDIVDRIFGMLAGVVTLLATVWLGSAILVKLPYPGLQNGLRGSGIISLLNKTLPQAPSVIADLSNAIDPNGFPQVFSGNEPAPNSATLPSLGILSSAVSQDQASVVKVEGEGCGGVVEGSGFVVATDTIVTNAHVVAGVTHPYVVTLNGSHYSTTTIWFDPNLDFAVLRVKDLAATPLTIDTQTAASGTASAVLGYPGGGSFTADPASVLQEFTADGRNIYNQGNTERDVYEVKATIIPGNSGGPLINATGQVIGIVFAQSTVYNQIGYALTTPAPLHSLQQAEASQQPVSTGACAE